MSNRQIQPVRNRDVQIIRQARPRSLWGQVWNIALQPNTFFLALPQAPTNSRQWFWVAVLILALNGFSAVRQDAISSGGGGSSDPSISQGVDFSGGGGVMIPGGSISAQPGGFPGGLPSDFGTPPDNGSSGYGSDVSSTWVTALISGTTSLLGWFVLALILCEVPLFNGVRPNYGQNLQIAIWTTVPIGIMAGLQVIYIAATGAVGEPGVSGLLPLWKGYNELSPLLRSILLSFTSRLTVFWIWSLILIFIGARQALNGKVWAVLLVVVIWVSVVVMVPVITGNIAAPEVAVEPLPEPIVLPDADLSTSEGGQQEIPTDDLAGTDNVEATPEPDITNPIFATPVEPPAIVTVESSDALAGQGSQIEPTVEPSTNHTKPELATPTP